MERSKVTILDGGFSSQIRKHITEEVDGHPLWTARFLITNPEAVEQTHLDYLNAGSSIISTNTYQANINLLKNELNLSDGDSLKLILKAVNIAKNARDKFMASHPNATLPLIAGSVGPYAAYLHDGSEYTGKYGKEVTAETLKEHHKPVLNALFEVGVDLFAFETIPCGIEAEVLVELLKNYPTIKAWLSFSCRTDGLSIANGDNFQEVALKCYNNNPDQIIAVGVNCVHPKVVEKLFEGINNHGNKTIPLIVYPNSGETYEDSGWVGKKDAIPLYKYISKYLDLGVQYVGSCCRTYAEDIKAIKEAVEKYETLNK